MQTSVYHFFVFRYGPNIFKISAQERLERLMFKRKTNDNIFRRVFALCTDSLNAFISIKGPLSTFDKEKNEIEVRVCAEYNRILDKEFFTIRQWVAFIPFAFDTLYKCLTSRTLHVRS